MKKKRKLKYKKLYENSIMVFIIFKLNINLIALCLILLLINSSQFLSFINSNLIDSSAIQVPKELNSSLTSQISIRQKKPRRKLVTKIIRIKRTRTKKTKAVKTTTTTKETITTRRGQSKNLCGVAEKNLNANLFFSIMNGQPAIKGSWPWILSLRSNTSSDLSYKCAGTIISSQHVLTAAHCFQNDASGYVFISSTINLDQKPSPTDIHFISRIFIHPLYSATLSINDIALVKLAIPLNFTNDLLPICLPDSSEYTFLYERYLFIAGWGSTTGFNGRSELSNEILQAKLQVISDLNCRLNFGVNGNYICALDPTPTKANVCFGDSGSGLMLYDGELKKWILYGVANYVLRDTEVAFRCNNKAPSIYAIVPQYLFWIKTTMLSF